MRYSLIVPAALVLAVAGSSAQAQTVRSTRTNLNRVPGAGSAIPSAVGTPFNFSGSAFQFVPGTGFVPLNNLGTGFGPGFFGAGTLPTGVQGPLQFVPGTGYVPQTNALSTGFGPGFFGIPSVTPGIQGPLQYVPGTGYVPLNQGSAATQGTPTVDPATGLPILSQSGFNSSQFSAQPGLGYGGGGYYGGGYYGGNGYYGDPYANGYGAYNDGFGYGVTSGYNNIPTYAVPVPIPVNTTRSQPTISAQITPGSRQEAAAAQQRADRTQQNRLAMSMQDVMDDRPMTEGRVVKIGATGVQVRLGTGEDQRVETYPVEQVFFFRTDGASGEEKLATVSSAPEKVHVGDRVMVPLSPEKPRQSVAGSRQEFRKGTGSGKTNRTR